MIPEPFPGHGPGDQEPSGSWSPAGGNEPRDAGRFPEDEEGRPEQGLFVCLPAEELTLAGFAEDGLADTMAPGPLLAAVVHAVTGEDGTGLAALSDDQLTGILSAARRMESRAAWSQMAALAEFAARRPARRDQGTRGTGAPDGAGISVFAAAELAGELNLTWPSVAEQMAYSRALKLILNTVIRGPCDHARAQRGYRPSRELRHLVSARNTRCTAPGCGRPASRCDLDHTTPWHQGGPTCPCNLAPLCRYHHRCKQAEGWWLEQPEPGVLKWRVPSGRTYVTTPAVYPV